MAKKHDHDSKPAKGNQTIVGTPGNDTLVGGKGDDKIKGGAGDDKLIGGKGNDKIFGGAGDDKIKGGKGNDLIFGGSGNDKIDGGKGNDKIFGGAGDDKIKGGKGDDLIFGGSGNDKIDGGKGNDKIFGGAGDDKIYGGAGADILIGGAGKDLFAYRSASESNTCKWDCILDFTQGEDKIDLSALLGATDLAWGNQTATANGAWYQNSGTSTFVYADTTGDGVADLKIELKHTPGLTLTANDFIGVTLNSAPVITSGTQAAAVTEVTDNAEGENATLHAASGAVTFTDADPGDTHTAGFVAGAAGYLGTFTLDPVADNSVGWSFEVQDADLDFLRGDETRVQTYTVTVNDGKGGTASQVVTITINGANDVPVITPGLQEATVTEVTDNDPLENLTLHSRNGAVMFSDVDLGDAHTAGFVAGGLGYLGSFKLGAVAGNSVGWTFEVEDSDLDFLLGGVTRVQTYTVTVDDGKGGTASQDVTITINGSADALFTENDDIVDFNALLAVNYTAGTQYNALGGNDVVILPADAAAAAAAGFDLSQTFYGGEGDDQITMYVGTPVNIDAGPGNDTLLLKGGSVVSVDLTDSKAVSVNSVPVGTNFENVDASGLAAGSSVYLTSNLAGARIVGSGGSDTMFISGDNSTVFGGADVDFIVVFAGGNNVLVGGPGDDQYVGGPGNDLFKFDFNLNATVTSDDGFDSIFSFFADPLLGFGADKMRFDFSAAGNWDDALPDPLGFLEGFFKLDMFNTRIALNDETWSVTVDVPFADKAAAFGVVDIYVNDVLIG